jgi:hypothetical protein
MFYTSIVLFIYYNRVLKRQCQEKNGGVGKKVIFDKSLILNEKNIKIMEISGQGENKTEGKGAEGSHEENGIMKGCTLQIDCRL